MTTLEKIVKKAQALKKSYPKKFVKWTDYVKEASKEFKKSPGPVVKKKTKIAKIKIYKVGDTFKGKKNSTYTENWQLFKQPNPAYIINDKTNKIVAVENTPYDAIKKRDSLYPNFKLHYNVYPKEYYKNENMNGVKKTTKKNTAKKLSNLIRTEIKSKKYIMPHGYEVRRSKLGAIMSISDNAKQLLIDCIDLDGYDMKANTPIEKIRAVEKIFYTEYGYLINRVGKLKALEEWLRGLPSVITIPFYNVEIIEIAKKWGSLKMNATEKQEDKILINYWRYMANQLLQLFNKKKLSDKFS